MMLVNKGHDKLSRLLFISFSNSTVFFIAMTLNFKGGMQFYNSVTGIAIVILFNFKDRREILALILLPAFYWFIAEPFLIGNIPSILLFKNAPIDIIEWINKIGAYSLTVIFMYILIKNLGNLRLRMEKKNEELIRLHDLSSRTEESAKIGSWQLHVKKQELFWSNQTYKIHALDVETKVSVEDGISFYHPEDQGKIQEALKMIMEKQLDDWQGDYRIINQSGEVNWVRVIGRGHFDDNGSPIYLEGSIQDINEEKMADMAKDEFLSTVSHEMRTPLMSVIGLSDVLLESQLDKEQKDLTNHIIDGGNAVLRIINDVLDLSKLRNKSLELVLSSTNLQSLIEEVVGILRHSAEAKGIALKTNINLKNPIVFCDSVRVRQVIINLVGNAIKFTNNGEVEVILHERNNLYEFTILDSGCGMNPDFIPKVFVPFEQDTEGKNIKKGTGLGMSITKKLVDLMNGTINIESQVNKGTSVNLAIRFDIDHKKATSEKKETNRDVDFKGIRLLYVDDTLMNQMVVSKLLKKTGCSVELANDGKEGFEKYLSAQQLGIPYDIILMDLQMPIMDGFEATREIRKIESDHKFKRIPILAFSAFSFEKDKQNALNAGCDGHIGKPIRKRELITKIEESLENEY